MSDPIPPPPSNPTPGSPQSGFPPPPQGGGTVPPPPAATPAAPPPPGTASAAPPPPGTATPLPFTPGTGDGTDRASLAPANRVSGVLLTLGGLLLIVGCFLPWAEIDPADSDLLVAGDVINTSPSGVDDVSGEVDGVGVVFILMGAMAAVVGFLALAGVVRLALKVIAIAVLALNALLALLVFFLVLTDEFISIVGTTVGIPTSLGAGIVVAVLGAVSALVGSILLRRRVS